MRRSHIVVVVMLAGCVPQVTALPCAKDENCPGVAVCLCDVCVEPDAGRPVGCGVGGGGAAGGSVGGGGAAGGSSGGMAGGLVAGGSAGGNGGGAAGGLIGGGLAGGSATGGGLAGGSATGGGLAGGSATGGGLAGGAATGGGLVGGGPAGGSATGGGLVGGGPAGGSATGGGLAGGSATGGGVGGGGCAVASCTSLSATCGRPPDGCGGQLPSCGLCTTPMTCTPQFVCAPADPVAQVRAVQAAADGILGGGTASIDLPIDGVVVTALKPVVAGADPVADAPGFFVQAGNAGLFVEVSTANPPPTVGNVVSFRVTSVAKEQGQRRAKAISNYSRLMMSGTLPSPVTLATLNTPQLRAAAESTLVRIASQPVSGGFDAGTGYGDVAFGSGIGVVRLPATLNATEDLRIGCTLTAEGPLWLTTGLRDQLHTWTSAQLAGTTCQPPAFVQVNSPDAGTLEVTTNRFMQPAGLNAFSIVSRGEGINYLPATVTLASPQRYILSGPWIRGFEYDLSASLTGPRDTRNMPAVMLPVLPFVAGGCTNTAPLAISTVFPGTSGQYIELHNRTTNPISLTNWRVVVRTASTLTINLPSTTLGAGQYFLISDGTVTDDWSEPTLNMVPGGTWIAVGLNLSTACNLSAAGTDVVSFGNSGGACPPVLMPPPRTGSALRRFDLRGCLDTNAASDWLDLTNPAPRRQMSPASVCLCP